MNYQVRHLEILMNEVARVTKQSLDTHGLTVISQLISEKTDASITKRYLSETFLKNLNAAKELGWESVPFQSYKIDKIAEFLGFENYNAFVASIENAKSPIVKGVLGKYYSYLRRNTEKGIVLCSPVRIAEEEDKVMFQLRGPEQNYEGAVEFRHNCLFILMKSPNGKQFHHVYPIGQKIQPRVLQGIFSGVSTSFEAIGGRAVLIRKELPFDKLENKSIDIRQAASSPELEIRRVAEYFKNYSDNNLRVLKAMTFGLDDLGGCE